MYGIVSCIKHRPNLDFYYVTADDGSGGLSTIELESSLKIELGEMTDAEGATAEPANGKHARLRRKLIEKAIERKVESALKKTPPASGVNELDKLNRKMWPEITKGASLLLKKFLTGAPIVVRFHNDADGSSGAYSIYKGLKDFSEGNGRIEKRINLFWIMNRGVIYGKEEANYDIMLVNAYESLEKPLMVLIDFGTSEKSNEGIKSIGRYFDILWLDHHPVPGGFEGKSLEYYINPWMFGGNSDYTAGLLSAVLVESFSNADTTIFKDASLIGDYSKYANPYKEAQDLSALLDLITSDASFVHSGRNGNLTPYEIEQLLQDKARSSELAIYANVRVAEAADEAIPLLRENNAGGHSIYTLDYSNVKEKQSRYPLLGRFSSKLLEKLEKENGKGCVVVCHVGNFISIRASRDIGEAAGLVQLAGALLERYGSRIDSAGGHRNAVGIKLSGESGKNEILRQIVAIIRKNLAE